MPQLDVSDAILDPEFVDEIFITRRPYTVNDNGQVVVTPTPMQIVAVVTQGSAHPLEQKGDAQYSGPVITVHAYQFQLYDAVTGKTSSYQPDLIKYVGNVYMVTKVYNWSQYGQGFTMAEAELYTTTEAGQ